MHNSNSVLSLRVLRIFGSKWEKGTGRCRLLHKEKLRDLYCLPCKLELSCRGGWERYVARIKEKRNVYRLLVEKPEGKRPLGRLRRRWGGNIKMDLVEIG
jgi:hypothetical protein